MAWYPTNIGGGGGGELHETVLWTNSSPTSNFAQQAVTLSQGISNFDYIGIYYRINTTAGAIGFEMAKASDFINYVGNLKPRVGFAVVSDNKSNFRNLLYSSDTSITITACIQSGTTSTNTSQCIPTAIVGLKYASPKPSGTETTLWTNSAPTSNFAAQSVTLSDSVNNYDFIKIYFNNNVSDMSFGSGSILLPVSYLKTCVSGSNNPKFAIGAVQVSLSSVRCGYYVNPTSIYFLAAYHYGDSNTSTFPQYIVPTAISGINF